MARNKKQKQLPKQRSIVTLGMILSRKSGRMTNRNEKRADEKDPFKDWDVEVYDDDEDDEALA